MTTFAPPTNGTPTSNAAARAIAHIKETQCELIYATLAQFPQGLTDLQMQDFTGICGDSQRARRGELLAEGRIVKTDETRTTTSGRAAAVWKVVGIVGICDGCGKESADLTEVSTAPVAHAMICNDCKSL